MGSNGTPIGTTGKGPLNTGRAVLTINLWGPKVNRTDGAGVPCVQEHCGIPNNAWNNGRCQTKTPRPMASRTTSISTILCTWDGANKQAYFGYKVIGLGFGGVAQMFGAKGRTKDANAEPASRLFSGTSWLRLSRDAAVGDTAIFVKGDVTAAPAAWEAGDQNRAHHH